MSYNNQCCSLFMDQLKDIHDLVRIFMRSIKIGSRDDLEYQKLLVNTLIDRIYLYDDHFDIFLNNSDRKGKVSDYEAADIERYFDNNPDSSSITLESGTPKGGDLPALFYFVLFKNCFFTDNYRL